MPESVIKWWMEKKCVSSPEKGTRGWKLFLAEHRKSTEASLAHLVKRVDNLKKVEPDSKRLKRNQEMLEAWQHDFECFLDLDPGDKICGGSRDMMGRNKHFKRYRVGADNAGPDDFDDQLKPGEPGACVGCG